MLNQIRNRNFYLMVGGDMVLFALAFVGAYFVRFDFALSEEMVKQSLVLLLFLVPVKAGIFLCFGLYRGMWRYVSLEDLTRLIYATSLSSLFVVAAIGFFFRFQGLPRSVFVLDFGNTLFLTGGFRLSIRLVYQRISRLEDGRIAIYTGAGRNQKPTLIVGAGDAGEKVFRELKDNPHLPYRVVGFVDDDPNKQGKAIHGIPIVSDIASLPETVKRLRIEEVLITVPSADGRQMRRIVEVCRQSGAGYKTLPGLGELIEGKVSINRLRQVRYEDLLGRPPVKVDTRDIKRHIEGRRVLVTGAGGSIGSELCRQIIAFDPDHIILMDASEPNLYAIQMELQHAHNYERYCAVLAKVQDRSLVEKVMEDYRPEVVLHAAAYKHVPLLETNPWEAIFNNVMGSLVVMEEAVEHGVERFVLVSTDKAVRPTNVMGTSKRLAELILEGLQGNGGKMMAVRFGNVVGSSGSVVPVFEEQIKRGGPVTVTHPDVMRYFMTIPEACQLILQAQAIGQGGEIFVLDMGTPVKIADMARDLIRLSGLEPEQDIKVVFTGLRPGEKLYEELIMVGENIVRTSHERIMAFKNRGNWNGHATRKDFQQWLTQGIQELCRLASDHDGPGIKRKLKELIPEYEPQNGECVIGCGRDLGPSGIVPQSGNFTPVPSCELGGRE